MTREQAEKVFRCIEKENMWYCFDSYSSFPDITSTDKEFARKVEKFLAAGHELENYLKSQLHVCTDDTVSWDREPEIIDGDRIAWHGECECGRQVYQIYSKESQIYDRKTKTPL